MITEDEVNKLKEEGWRVAFRDFGWVVAPPGSNVALLGFSVSEEQAWEHILMMQRYPMPKLKGVDLNEHSD